MTPLKYRIFTRALNQGPSIIWRRAFKALLGKHYNKLNKTAANWTKWTAFVSKQQQKGERRRSALRILSAFTNNAPIGRKSRILKNSWILQVFSSSKEKIHKKTLTFLGHNAFHIRLDFCLFKAASFTISLAAWEKKDLTKNEPSFSSIHTLASSLS